MINYLLSCLDDLGRNGFFIYVFWCFVEKILVFSLKGLSQNVFCWFSERLKELAK
jgi:hypothetical protein